MFDYNMLYHTLPLNQQPQPVQRYVPTTTTTAPHSHARSFGKRGKSRSVEDLKLIADVLNTTTTQHIHSNNTASDEEETPSSPTNSTVAAASAVSNFNSRLRNFFSSHDESSNDESAYDIPQLTPLPATNAESNYFLDWSMAAAYSYGTNNYNSYNFPRNNTVTSATGSLRTNSTTSSLSEDESSLMLNTTSTNIKHELSLPMSEGCVEGQVVKKKQRTHMCQYCEKSFYTGSCLKSHMKIHTRAPNSYVCQEDGCDKTYSTSEGLRLHIRNYHDVDKKWKCTDPECSKEFVRQSDLRLHFMRIHSEVRPFPCTFGDCGKTFACLSELKRHEASHERKMAKRKRTMGNASAAANKSRRSVY